MITPLLIAAVLAADPSSLMTTPGKQLVSEDFSTNTLPKGWQTRGADGVFTIVDGSLHAVHKSGNDKNDPFVIVPLKARDITVRCSLRIDKPGNVYIAIDGFSPLFNGNTHLVRLNIRPKTVGFQQDRGGPDDKHAQKEAKAKLRKEGKAIPQPTPEQLADPKFWRTEVLDEKPLVLADGKWHEVILELSGNDLVAHIDNQPVLYGRATVADTPKARLTFMVGDPATIALDNIRITENTRRPDWEQVKQTFAPAPPKGAAP